MNKIDHIQWIIPTYVFKTIEHINRLLFDKEVQKHLNEGWKPVGGVSVDGGYYMLGMTKEEKKLR